MTKTTLWLCHDCTFVHCNGDLEADAVEADRRAEINDGLAVLEGQGVLTANFDSNADEDRGIEEFSRRQCDSCGTHLAGYRARFELSGKEPL